MDNTRFKNTHRASVVAILGGEAPRVSSRGSRFYNVDRWTARVVVKHMCDWARQHPGVTPSLGHVTAWVDAANAERVDPSAREIVIAETPEGDALTTRVAMALVGGGYHEAFHTRYSCRRTLSAREIADIVIPRWRKVTDWSPLAGTLLEWGNLIEDIRIERRGNDEYPGTFIKLCDLQDLVLGQETDARAQAAGDAKMRAMLVVNGTFRDLGLGYATEAQDAVIRWYETADPAAYAMVTSGPLSPLLDEAIVLSAADDLGHLRLAMDVIAALVQTGNDPNGGSDEGTRSHGGQPQPGQGSQSGQGQPGQGQPGQQGGAGSQPGQPGAGKGQPGQGQPGQGQGAGTGAKADGQGAGGSGEGKGGKDGEGKGSPSGKGETRDGSGTSPSEEAGNGAGGHHFDPGPVAQSYLSAAAQGYKPGLKDGASALEQAVNGAKNRENRDCKKGEAPYRPFTTDGDQVAPVKPSKAGAAADRATVDAMTQSVRRECAFLRARLRSVFRAMEEVETVHGVRRGATLSDRTLVESAASLRAGHAPDRAYQRTGDRVDNSLAAVVVLDQSGSMGWGGPDKLTNAIKGVLAIVDPLDALGCAVEAVGFRDGKYQNPDGGAYHRTSSVNIDVFKGFDERFSSVKARFASARAVGGTPMADGLQHGINSLQGRREGHRIIFVVTDGEPNGGHGPVIRRQIRLAREAGVHVIGVGIGREASYVTGTFDDSVFVEDIQALPGALIRKLNAIVDTRRVKVAGRNRRIATA
jgi:Mg-chelatase subunit ChlD